MLLVVAATEPELRGAAGAAGVERLVCGIGPVEAAARTAAALATGRGDAVLHVGIAGARGVEPPGLVLGSESVYADLLDPASPLRRVERVRPDPGLLAAARAALPGAVLLPIGTSGRVGGGSCAVEAMEGFGVLRAAELAGVPAVELRAISNRVGEEDRARWRVAEALAALERALAALVPALA